MTCGSTVDWVSLVVSSVIASAVTSTVSTTRRRIAYRKVVDVLAATKPCRILRC